MKKKKLITTCMALALSCFVSASGISPAVFTAYAKGNDEETSSIIESSDSFSEDMTTTLNEQNSSILNSDDVNLNITNSNDASQDLPDISSSISPEIYEDVNSIFENTTSSDPAPIDSLDEAAFLPYEAYDLLKSSNISEIAGSLTPQQFGAVGDGIADDSEAFRKMFIAAFEAAPSSNSWKHCKAIYIPSGVYRIEKPIIDENLVTSNNKKVRYAMFEVTGAGRESTTIKMGNNCGVLFDNQIKDKNDPAVVFGFSTFRDIEFEGSDDKQTLMNIKDGNVVLDTKSKYYGKKVDGVQRLQFISCSFRNWNEILHCMDSTIMLSEMTFAFCKISDCGTTTHPCRLFTLNCPQAVNWRFLYTDIESFVGDAFYYIKGTHIFLLGGSIIPSGDKITASNGEERTTNVFFFDFPNSAQRDTVGRSNSPHAICFGTRFEIKDGSSCVRTTSISKGEPKVSFKSCNMNTSSNNPREYFVFNGAADITMEDCYDCGSIRISGNLNTNPDGSYLTGSVNPTLRFINCPDVDVDTLATESVKDGKYQSAVNDLGKNNVHVIVDNTYDFYIRNNKDARAPYLHTLAGLHECRQAIDNLDYRTYTAVDNDNHQKIFTAKPYGFVKYIELTTAPWDSSSGDITLTLYDTSTKNGKKQLGEQITIPVGEAHTHIIYINDYVENLQGIFSHSLSKDPKTCMTIEIVKY